MEPQSPEPKNEARAFACRLTFPRQLVQDEEDRLIGMLQGSMDDGAARMAAMRDNPLIKALAGVSPLSAGTSGLAASLSTAMKSRSRLEKTGWTVYEFSLDVPKKNYEVVIPTPFGTKKFNVLDNLEHRIKKKLLPKYCDKIKMNHRDVQFERLIE